MEQGFFSFFFFFGNLLFFKGETVKGERGDTEARSPR